MPRKEKVQIEVDVSKKKLHVQHATCPKGHQLCCDEKKIHGFPALKVKGLGTSFLIFLLLYQQRLHHFNALTQWGSVPHRFKALMSCLSSVFHKKGT